jgi:hypothetical protein
MERVLIGGVSVLLCSKCLLDWYVKRVLTRAERLSCLITRFYAIVL